MCVLYTHVQPVLLNSSYTQPLCHAPQLLAPFNVSRMETWTKSRV